MKQEIVVTATGPELIIREGKAAEIFPPRKVELTGNIEAPAEFFKKRADYIEEFKKLTHVIIDHEGLEITLVVNESDNFAKIVKGTLEFFQEFAEFGINRDKKYSITALYKMLRLKRAYFKDRDAHATILDQLKKFEAKTEIEFKSMNDFKGSTALQKIQNCKTNLTYNFVLNIPIYKGFQPNTFPVEIEFEPHDGGIICWLLSQDLAELEIQIRDKMIEDQLKAFEDIVIIKK